MPVKNAASFLEECIDSILHQSCSAWELIAVDDGSSDKSWSIMHQYATKHPRIHCIKNRGTGIIEALKTAYSEARGNYISRMDADDKMHTDKLKTLYQLLLQKGKGFVATGLVHYFSRGILGKGYQQYQYWLNHLTRHQQNFTELYKECVIPSPCWMIHKEDLDRCGAFDSAQYPEDYDLCFRWYKHHINCAGAAEVLHYWRDSANRASRTDPNYADNNFLKLKVHYFLELDRDIDRPLVIWGAGKKGKKLARILRASLQKFEWVCNNRQKIGHTIQGVKIAPCSLIGQLKKPQVIVVVAQNEAQKTITNQLEAYRMRAMLDYFFFC